MLNNARSFYVLFVKVSHFIFCEPFLKALNVFSVCLRKSVIHSVLNNVRHFSAFRKGSQKMKCDTFYPLTGPFFTFSRPLDNEDWIKKYISWPGIIRLSGKRTIFMGQNLEILLSTAWLMHNKFGLGSWLGCGVLLYRTIGSIFYEVTFELFWK